MLLHFLTQRRSHCLIGIIAALCVCATVDCDHSALPLRQARQVDDHEIVKAAEWAVDQLRGLSDSGVYTSISLYSIKSAATQEGIYHFNTFLTLSLACPYYKSGKALEDFEVIVMRHLSDNRLSFAIDNFPEVNEEAIESYWIQRVERHREERENLFRALEQEALEKTAAHSFHAAGLEGMKDARSSSFSMEL